MPRFQFGLPFLGGVTVFVSVVVAAVWIWPTNVELFVLVAIMFLTPQFLLLEVMRGKNYRKAFCLGALLPSCLLLALATLTAPLVILSLSDEVRRLAWNSVRWACGITWAMAMISGLLCCLRLRIYRALSKRRSASAERDSVRT